MAGNRHAICEIFAQRIAPETLSGGPVAQPSPYGRTAAPEFDKSPRFLFQLADPLLQELALGFLLGQRQSFLISGAGLSRPAEPAVHICLG
jgi:hypothetical protein